ncbi:hypothetical protein NDU88_007793 [Pleurodeles waltl]|uniref:Uncharacterized protein n=1 Tax=Pleurodeles waltl TaxID=8319 RepID=A0AAV7N369_PLEWA|nr:hypothetical protein NDU88_007793 [Pleurodeles waltl]
MPNLLLGGTGSLLGSRGAGLDCGCCVAQPRDAWPLVETPSAMMMLGSTGNRVSGDAPGACFNQSFVASLSSFKSYLPLLARAACSSEQKILLVVGFKLLHLRLLYWQDRDRSGDRGGVPGPTSRFTVRGRPADKTSRTWTRGTAACL